MFTVNNEHLPDVSMAVAREISTIVSSTEFPSYDRDLKVSESEYADLSQKWREFTGPVRDVRHFMLCNVIRGCDGLSGGDADLYLCAEYRNGNIEVSVKYDDQIDESLLPLYNKVTPIKGGSSPGANSRCSRCNKKMKRCRCV